MSTLNEEILRLEQAKVKIDEILIARGVSIPTGATLDTYYELINSIQGGISSSEVTATRADVLAGTYTITSDSEDAVVEGTMQNYSGTRQDTDGVWIGNGYINMSVKNPGYYAGNSDLRAVASDFGNATQSSVLTGNTFTSSNGIKLSGSMPNNGAVSKTITPSESAQTYTIPSGYHSGSGKVTVNAVEPVLRQITVTGYPECCLYIDADGYVASALDAPSTYVIGASEVTIYARDGIVMFDGTNGGQHSSYYLCTATGEYDEYSTPGLVGTSYREYTRLFRFLSNGSIDIEPMGA